MTYKKEYICDECNDEIDPMKDAYYEVEQFGSGADWETRHYCNDCVNDYTPFVEWLRERTPFW